ncbi:hypothetical protein [Paenibacillus glycinis]|uniref:Uncharacterized protein n=1 Tax=Paenibacillus glycinis TaxID=2697035 RepID=A0ABW9XPG4_9BACL|nr:hypothetical protein [Paenibacillus glycinis]NBD24311.1 hypothetical protein [Paenibacillus glycinis]
MAKSMQLIRIVANACITCVTANEGDIDLIVDSYNLTEVNRELVRNEIYVKRPDFAPPTELSV